MKRSRVKRVKKARGKRLSPAEEVLEDLKKFIEVEDDHARRTTETKEPDKGAWDRARMLLAWESVSFD
jgi:hypothetical protein